ncbi:PhoX family phosphatase [Bordetella sp. N]|uniref:PhoX family protein n=1 Tax=Bordetella sp. N TaxID=1746199 RepID=UPI00070F9BC6|nr:PhoX family phosphatase [Bordetella sp. N]ALM82165.1 dTDP-glucose 4,6-dehydratase [Bordetella sp. N]
MSHSTDEAKSLCTPSSRRISPKPGQTLDEVLAADPARRTWLKSGFGMAALSVFGATSLTACGGDHDDDDDTPVSNDPPAEQPPTETPEEPAREPGLDPNKDYSIRFQSVARTTADTVTVPTGYEVQVLFSTGDAVEAGSTAWTEGVFPAWDVTDKRAGGDNDGMHYFALPNVDPQQGGLLAINHEQVDLKVYFPSGTFTGSFNEATATLDQKRLALSSVGVSVIEVAQTNGAWSVKKDSTYNRRYTGNSAYSVGGPARSRLGATIIGTLNNCSSGATPWGTYLTCEETTSNYFDSSQPDINYGWVVELDPRGELLAQGTKRTAMGRFAHENVAYLVDENNRVAFYMGDDTTPGCIYKFIPTRAYDPANRAANVNLLDEGTLYVAQFNAGGGGVWIPLVQGNTGLTSADGFATQADVLIECQDAAVSVGGTVMDRPEWITVGPNKDIFVTLTNNSGRGTNAPVDAANPRAENHHGHIIRWNEAGNSPLATTFTWSIFLLAGDPAQAASLNKPNLAGNINGDAFSSPDGIRLDAAGRLWVETDMNLGSTASTTVFGNNGMYCIDPTTGLSKRFLVGPVGCEITGIAYTPDLTTFFVNIQHPTQAWPTAGRTPRSSTIVIRRPDTQPVGA